MKNFLGKLKHYYQVTSLYLFPYFLIVLLILFYFLYIKENNIVLPSLQDYGKGHPTNCPSKYPVAIWNFGQLAVSHLKNTAKNQAEEEWLKLARFLAGQQTFKQGKHTKQSCYSSGYQYVCEYRGTLCLTHPILEFKKN